MEMLSIFDPERRCSALSTYTVTFGNFRGEDYNATNRERDPLKILFCLTDAILIIGALLFVISVFVTFSVVGLAIFQTVQGHVEHYLSNHYISRFLTNKNSSAKI